MKYKITKHDDEDLPPDELMVIYQNGQETTLDIKGRVFGQELNVVDSWLIDVVAKRFLVLIIGLSQDQAGAIYIWDSKSSEWIFEHFSDGVCVQGITYDLEHDEFSFSVEMHLPMGMGDSKSDYILCWQRKLHLVKREFEQRNPSWRRQLK